MRLARELSSIFGRDYVESAIYIARISLREQYRNSYLGMFWALIHSVVYILTLSVVFSMLLKSSIKDYAVFMMSGMLPWQFFVAAVTRGAASIASRRTVFHHTPLPKTMFVLADVLAQLYPFCIALCVAIAFTFTLEGFKPTAFLIFPALLPLVATAVALAILFAYVSAYLWDIPHALNLLFQIIVWTAPIMYPIGAVPESMRRWFTLNPIYVLIHPVQQLLYEGVLPSASGMAGACLVAVFSVVMSYVVYVRLRKNVIYYL